MDLIVGTKSEKSVAVGQVAKINVVMYDYLQITWFRLLTNLL